MTPATGTWCPVEQCTADETACVDRGFTVLREPRPVGCWRDVQDRINQTKARVRAIVETHDGSTE